MADLDAELLALAGGDSSDEETLNQPTVSTKVETASSSTGSPSDHLEVATSSKTNASPRKSNQAKAGGMKGAKNGRGDESAEEGEASDTSASPSLNSAPMSESGTDISPPSSSDKDELLFPFENKYKSEKDKAEILAKPEVEREGILAERAQLLETRNQDRFLRQLLKAKQQKESGTSKVDSKKRKVSTADLEEVKRKSSRQKTTLGGRKVGETSDAIQAYKLQREQKGALAQQRKTEAARRKARKGRGSMSTGSEADADGESDVEWDNNRARDGRRTESPPHNIKPAALIDYNHVRVGRENLAKYCHYPGFEETIKDCFVRIGLGPDKSIPNGPNVYRMAKIKAITEGRMYAIDGCNGIPFTTNQYIMAQIGKSEREWPFLAISQGDFTERELNRYTTELAKESIALPTLAFLISKVDAINNLVNRSLTDAEIQAKLIRSGVLKRKANNIERTDLRRRRMDAEYDGDAEEISKIDAQLLALDGPRLAFGTSLYKPAPPPPTEKTQQQRLFDINQRNRKQNTIDVRKAQIAERMAAKLLREAVERGEAEPDPFARVKIRAKTHYDVNALYTVPKPRFTDLKSKPAGGQSDTSRAGTPGTGVATPSKNPSPTPTAPSTVAVPPTVAKETYPWLTARNYEQEFFDYLGTIDCEIDMSIFDE